MADGELEEAVCDGQSERLMKCNQDTEKQPGLVGSWAKEHCDHVLDSIDAQLSQWQGPGVQVMGSSRDHDISSDTSLDVSWLAELEEQPAAKAEYLQTEASQSSSSSVCTEDFAARFQEGMVEPLVFSEDEEDEPFSAGIRHARDVPAGGNGISCPAEDHDSGQDESLLSTGRRQEVPWQLEVELGCPLQSTSPSLMRRQSLESLGGRISRLSQSNAVTAGMEPASFPGWWAPMPAPSEQGWTLHGADVRGCLTRRRAGVPVPRASVSADSSLPGDGDAGTRWHRVSRPVRSRQQETPALRRRSGRDVVLAVADVDMEGAGDRLRRAQSWAHCTNTAARPPRVCSLDSSGDRGSMDTYKESSSCGGSCWRSSSAERWTWSPGKAAKPWWEHARLEASLDHKRAGREPASLSWSLQRNWKGVQELGSFAKKIQSKGDRARTGPALLEHTHDACWQELMELEKEVQSRLLEDRKTWGAEKKGIIQSQQGLLGEQSQGACADCQEGLEKELRKTSALQEEKLELQKRLHELEHRTRSLLQWRQEALDELHVLLQKEKMDMLRQLQEALEQERARNSTWLQAHLQRLEQQHLLWAPHKETSLQEPAVPGQAGRSLARHISLACQRLRDLLPDNSMGQSPSPAVFGHALRVLHGLSEEIQRHLRDLQREREAQRCSVLHLWREKEHELRQQREWIHMEKEAGPRALKEQLIQRQSKYPYFCSTSSLSSSTMPCLRQQNFRRFRVLHQIQNCMQELQAENTTRRTGNLENLTVLTGELGTQQEKRYGDTLGRCDYLLPQPHERMSPKQASDAEHHCSMPSPAGTCSLRQVHRALQGDSEAQGS
ncbi:uncharacterized protein LOC112971302 isoform X2 [Apteryx rowi]|uniref:uncharacterized protein LOC112971302 isoform X2 n=1 Tax=Apteryx rowi TaxID=308060 RepID=UPI000E1D4539|nr:uncharacterized protein LOC112971302 isoform X2 [Apteryx rowi]